MKEYVICYVEHPVDHTVLLVLKDRPLNQFGKLNLVGGHIESTDASPVAAAKRELMEESGLVAVDSWKSGEIIFKGGVVHCVNISLDPAINPILNPRKEETEIVSWHKWSWVKDDERLMSNLRTIIPYMCSGIKGFKLFDVESIEELMKMAPPEKPLIGIFF